MAFTRSILCLIIGSLVAAPGAARAAAKASLLAVSRGDTAEGTGKSGEPKRRIIDGFDEMGGRTLKVFFADGEGIGTKKTSIRNWKAFQRLRFDVFNPATETVSLTLTIVHAGSTNSATQVKVPFRVRPGKNEFRVPIDRLANADGTPADLGNVLRWDLRLSSDAAVALYLGDIVLDDGKDADSPAATSTASSARSDPARLERLRAAKMPAIDRPVLFNTPEADAVCAALEVFPPNNPWNLLVDDWPVHPNSRRIIASNGAGTPLNYNRDMGFVLVPPGQKQIDVEITRFADESDGGPFPLPDNVPVEGWPLEYPGLSLPAVQAKVENGDRHAIVVDPVNRKLYEFSRILRVGRRWSAYQASVFDLASNRLRPEGWTSTDAAGLPIFPAVVRYDEIQRGRIEHALRVTVPRTRSDHVYPARHDASRRNGVDLPRMGERLRLRKDFDISGFSREGRVILTALKRYGMFVADNGTAWLLSVAPDERIPDVRAELHRVKGSDFEVVLPPPDYRPPSR
jgi:hypothetical protein